jgi:hypothetical protein
VGWGFGGPPLSTALGPVASVAGAASAAAGLLAAGSGVAGRLYSSWEAATP